MKNRKAPVAPAPTLQPHFASAAALALLLAKHRDLIDGLTVEVNLPATGITGMRFVDLGGGNHAVKWQADGTDYVVQRAELRQLAAVFDALADQAADLEPIYQGVQT